MMTERKQKCQMAWGVVKLLLEKDYIEGCAQDDMSPRNIQALCIDCPNVKATNFRNKWIPLKEGINGHKAQLEEDTKLYCHNMELYKVVKNIPQFWNG
eukprot:1328580-Ditylum_brightwellii.AAC.1